MCVAVICLYSYRHAFSVIVFVLEDMRGYLPLSQDSRTKGIQSFCSHILSVVFGKWPKKEWEASIFPCQHGDGDVVATGDYCRTWVDTTMGRPNLNPPGDGSLCVWLIVCGVKRLVIGCYSKRHNCPVKDERTQMGSSVFKWRSVCFHGVHPWNERACKWEVTQGLASSPATKGRAREPVYSAGAVVPLCVAHRDTPPLSLPVYVCAVCSYLPPSSPSVPPFPSASVVLACLVNLCRSPWIFRLTWLTSGVCSIGNRFPPPPSLMDASGS